jgi:hypothetical protein
VTPALLEHDDDEARLGQLGGHHGPTGARPHDDHVALQGRRTDVTGGADVTRQAPRCGGSTDCRREEEAPVSGYVVGPPCRPTGHRLGDERVGVVPDRAAHLHLFVVREAQQTGEKRMGQSGHCGGSGGHGHSGTSEGIEGVQQAVGEVGSPDEMFLSGLGKLSAGHREQGPGEPDHAPTAAPRHSPSPRSALRSGRSGDRDV